MYRTLVILVDNNDSAVGTMEKIEAHRLGRLHRAVSVFIIDRQKNWIMQKRAHDKYHSKGLWTNTCCTHPLPGESNLDAARRRLKEEMGISCKLEELFSFIYREKLDNELIENEYDHVFVGISEDDPVINISEVDDWKRISFDELHLDIRKNPGSYTCWFKEIYQDVHSHLLNLKAFSA